MPKSTWWNKGIQFECQGSGRCCVSRGEYGFVYLSLKDRQRMARHLGLQTREFTRRYCEKEGALFHLKEASKSDDCQFLVAKRCRVYEARPTQCRTWPFWPENLNAKTWKTDVASFCPGVGKGRLWTGDEILATLDEVERDDRSTP